MSIAITSNDTVFSVLLQTLESCKNFNHELTKTEQLNSTVNDEYLARMISNGNELNLNISNSFFRKRAYNDLLTNALELDRVIKLPLRLIGCINDKSRCHEAIILLEQIEQLHKNHGHLLPLVENIYGQSQKLREYLVAGLCYRLEHLEETSESDVVRIVNYLADCGNFTERELKLKYLQARDNWFNNACEEQSASFDSVVSVYCSGMPTIFKEYKALFGASSSERMDNMLMKVTCIDSEKDDGAIINSWLLLKTSIFIASLEVYLDTIHQSGTQTPTMISDTMLKCFELTGWLASIGFDFSSRLKPLFSKALMEEVKSSIEVATSRFEAAFAATVSKSIESLLLPVDDEILRISNISKPEEQLPKSIQHYPIFKIYCLYLIDSLRWLHTTKDILCPLNLCLVTYSSLNTSLTRAMKALSTILYMDNNATHPILSKIAMSLMTEVLPFLNGYCERLFPEKSILNAIGLTKSEFKTIYTSEPNKLKNFRLDLRQIADPLRSTMPSLMQTIEGWI